LGKSQATGLALASLFPEMNKAIGVWKKAVAAHVLKRQQSDRRFVWEMPKKVTR
jgi:hypothetical protein